MTAPTDSNIKFIIADDIREEQGGKFTAVGMFTSGIKLLQPAPNAVLASIAFLWIVSDGDGSWHATVTVKDPNRKEMLKKEVGNVTKLPGQVMNILIRLLTFPVGLLGTYEVTLDLDGTAFTRTFTVEK
jgi:hypothetical protein